MNFGILGRVNAMKSVRTRRLLTSVRESALVVDLTVSSAEPWTGITVTHAKRENS